MDEMIIENLKNTDIRTVDPDSLVDIRGVSIDPSLPKQDRLRDFVRQIKNPYCYKVGKAIVKVSFSDTRISMEDRLESYFAGL